MTTDAEQAPDGVDPEEVMAVLFKPVADLVWAVQESGATFIAMLLRHEYQRGYAAGSHARALDHGPACPASGTSATLRDRTATDNIRLSRPGV